MLFGPKPESKILPTERRVMRIRPHWASLSRIIVQTVFAVFVLVGIMWFLDWAVGESVNIILTVLWGTALLAISRLLYHIIFWWGDTLMITDKRFVRVRGVFTDKTDMMPISKVTDMTYFTSFIGNWLNYGTIRIESAGQIQGLELIQYIPNHETVYEGIAKLVFGGKDHTSTLPPPKRRRKRQQRPEEIVAAEMTQELSTTDDISNEWPQELDNLDRKD